ncbi:hypothetical protein [Bradyrhizobium sp. SYSU BS000235]|uniref:hypothetical protein n=1 Tax=Bradyrhizobium sp. SYSU BS000235 TaxID=3411332 RepID=UPI003C780954
MGIVLAGFTERSNLCDRLLAVVGRVVIRMIIVSMIIVSVIIVCRLFMSSRGLSRLNIRSSYDGNIVISLGSRLFDDRVSLGLLLSRMLAMMIVVVAIIMMFLIMVMGGMMMLVIMCMLVMMECFGLVMIMVMTVVTGVGLIKMIGGVLVRLRNVCLLLRVDALGAAVLDDVALHALAMIASPRTAMTRAPTVGAIFRLFFSFAMRAFVGLDESLTVCNRDLIVVRMNFAEGEEAVTITSVFDKRGLQRWFYPRDLGKIDVAAELFALGGLEIKFFDAVAAHHDHPGLFRMGGIDQHFVGHLETHDGGWHA